MRRASIGLLLAAAVLVWAPLALAKSHGVSSLGEASGQIVVSWHGDPAQGCAAAGVCDVSGTVVYRPDSVEVRGRLFDSGRFVPTEADLDSNGPSTVRVRRVAATGASSVCVDTVDATSFYLAPRRRGRTRYGFNGIAGGSGASHFSSGRCAGPLPEDLASLQPSGMLDTARLGRRSATFDLSQRKAFTAGPFSGELTSTMTARMSRAGSGEEGEFITTEGSSEEPPGRTHRTLELELEYDVTGISGSIVTSFAGTSDPFCAPLDACGSHGESSLSAQATSGSLTVMAHRILGRHERPTVALALRDLRKGRLSVDGFLNLGDESSAAHLSSSVTRSDGSTCTDGGEEPQVDLRTEPHARGLRFDLSATGDSVRTRCEGPSELDVVHRGALAGANASVDDLVKRSVQLRLLPAPAFRSGAYAGTRSGAIVVNLRRARVRVGTGSLEVL